MARGSLYSEEEKRIILDMYYERRQTPVVIAQVLTQQGYSRTARNIANYLYYHAKKHPRPKQNLPENYLTAFEQLENQRSHMLDVSRSHYTTVGFKNTKADTKVLILTDLHVPFELDNVIQHALEHHSDAAILVIGGDLFEAYSVSAFRKDRAILFRWEYTIALEYIKLFAGLFDHVVLISGNHERRMHTYITKQIGNMFRGLIPDDPMKLLANGMGYDDSGEMSKLYDFPNVIYDGYPRGDYARIGQLIVAHPNNYSTIPMRSVIMSGSGLRNQERFHAIIMGHTHKMGKIIVDDVLYIEAGCCCMPLEYTFAQGKIMMHDQSFGYAVAYLDKDGNVDFDRTGPVYLGRGHIIKPETINIETILKAKRRLNGQRSQKD